MKLAYLFLFLISPGAVADWDCNGAIKKVGRPYYEICLNEELLRANPGLIYNCVVEYNLDYKKWFAVARESKVDPNSLCVANRPLDRAIQVRPELVDELISAGADPNLMDGHCRTGIGWAAYMGDLGIFKKLQAAGGDAQIRDGEKVEGVCKPSAKFNTPFHWAAEMGRTKIVDHLIEQKLNTEDYGFFGLTPLMQAADGVGCRVCGDYAATVKSLLQTEASVGAVSIEQEHDKITGGQTALFYAAFRGHFDSVKLLVEAGSDVNHVNRHGITIMDGADHALFFRSQKIKYLCSRGARSPLCK